ncbi:PREDICTED: protein kintoun [Papilio xuthus]|uniref:Protein kintoun n=1 Tax=Papilio xuthus TaxID=66420 RepID=A0AAJ7ELK3_PAPXU|nr:PREDICTED: protein kintoun [Papilio xuthus]
MATGVKPRDDEPTLTRTDIEAIQEAMKSKKFREMLADYCDEVRDPANQALYQKEMTQLEKERGYDITFINPKGGYVIKTSVAGDRKAFINICSNENIGKPLHSVESVNGQKGMNWQIPYSLIPPREDYDNKKQRCIIYDVVFHPDTLRMAEVNERFREIVNKTAFDGLQSTYKIHLDINNCRFPKSFYKGMTTSAVFRKEDPNFKPPTEEDSKELSPEIIEKLYPQHNYTKQKEPQESSEVKTQAKRKAEPEKKEFSHSIDEGYTIPKYIIKQQKNVDLQDYTFHKNSKQYSAIPSQLVVEINLPLISSTKDCILDVNEKSLSLVVEKPAKYKLNLTLPYPVDDNCGNAKFDKTKHMLIVTLPVIRNVQDNGHDNLKLLKVDSGVESEENSGSQSDEDNTNGKKIIVLSSNETSDSNPPELEKETITDEPFLETSISYVLPSYTHNILDDVIAFTFHVKNTEPESVMVKNDGNEITIKFTTIGSGFVPVHHAAIIVFGDNIKFKTVNGEAWDNNVILQLELAGDIPQSFNIGLTKDSMTTEHLDASQIKQSYQVEESNVVSSQDEVQSPFVEVTNLGLETNIVVSSNCGKDEECEREKENDIVWVNSGTCENGAKSILRKSMSMMRSFSESSAGDVASSMDYISSDYIPEESSLKKTVRFSDVIARQFYRYNSSIEGQKKKNQRRKSKKRNQERRKSESEAEEETNNSIKSSKPRLKSVLKQRRDSGLADTSDAEAECKNMPSDSELSCDSTNSGNKDVNANAGDIPSLNVVDKNGNTNNKYEPHIWKSKNQPITNVKKQNPVTCDNIKHTTDFYNPEKLNKGQYTEVMFKNDLIFDLDM